MRPKIRTLIAVAALLRIAPAITQAGGTLEDPVP